MGDTKAWTETLELNLRSVKAELEHSKVVMRAVEGEGGGGTREEDGASPLRAAAAVAAASSGDKKEEVACCRTKRRRPLLPCLTPGVLLNSTHSRSSSGVHDGLAAPERRRREMMGRTDRSGVGRRRRRTRR